MTIIETAPARRRYSAILILQYFLQRSIDANEIIGLTHDHKDFLFDETVFFLSQRICISYLIFCDRVIS